VTLRRVPPGLGATRQSTMQEVGAVERPPPLWAATLFSRRITQISPFIGVIPLD